MELLLEWVETLVLVCTELDCDEILVLVDIVLMLDCVDDLELVCVELDCEVLLLVGTELLLG